MWEIAYKKGDHEDFWLYSHRLWEIKKNETKPKYVYNRYSHTVLPYLYSFVLVQQRYRFHILWLFAFVYLWFDNGHESCENAESDACLKNNEVMIMFSMFQ